MARKDDPWWKAVERALASEGPRPDVSTDLKRVEQALANARKQHLWGMLTDIEVKLAHKALERQQKALLAQTEPMEERPMIGVMRSNRPLMEDILWREIVLVLEQELLMYI